MGFDGPGPVRGRPYQWSDRDGPPFVGDLRRRPIDPIEEDEAIRQAVRWSLFEDTWLDARDIDVRVERGVVTLSGRVKEHLAARYAWDDAWETAGVRGVISRLEVATGEGRAGRATDPPG